MDKYRQIDSKRRVFPKKLPRRRRLTSQKYEITLEEEREELTALVSIDKG